MSKIEISEQPLLKNGQKVGKVAILRGGLNTDNPTEIMDNAVSKYVDRALHNQFIEIHLDNPWVRVVVSGINDLKYDDFTDQHLLDD